MYKKQKLHRWIIHHLIDQNNKSPSEKILRENGFKRTETTVIRSFLSKAGIVKVVSKGEKKTMVLVGYDEALKIVAKIYKEYLGR